MKYRRRTSSWFRRALASCVTVALLGTASNALAGNQGDRYGANPHQGTRASIKINSSALGTDPSSIWATVAMQSAPPPTFADNIDGLSQIGYFRDTANANVDCGKGVSGIAYEHKYMGLQYLCNMYAGTFGVGDKFAVVSNTVTPSLWQVFINGSQINGHALGFSGGYPVARGEYNYNSASMSITFGQAGGTPWQFSDDHGTSWTTFLSAPSATLGSGWSVGTPPSPFVISH